jgi:hypothetical protein
MNRILMHKMSKSGILAFLLAAALGGAAPALAAGPDGGAPGDWLSNYTTAQSLALGGSFVAVTQEPLGVVWNPAGLSFMSQNQASFEVGRLYESTNLYGVGIGVPARKLPSIGFTVLSMSSGDFERTSELNEPLGSFGEGDLAMYLTGSKAISPRFAIGANLKIARQSVEEFDATGVGFDLGAMYDISPMFRLGGSVLNLGGPNLSLRDVTETYPVEFRVGASAKLFRGQGLLTMEIDQNADTGAGFHGGAQYWLYENFALTVGYATDSPAGGFSYRTPSGIRFDYALADQDLGMTHRFGVSYSFGGFMADSQADPTVFSPLGQQSVTRIDLKAKTKAEATDWALDITDKSGAIVRTFGGPGEPPSHVMWDGKNQAGLPVPDGLYTYSLTVNDAEGRLVAGRERAVEITTGGPQGNVPVSVAQD